MIINLGNRVVNNYLIPGDEGYILIDTGYPNGFRRFLRRIRKAGIDPKEIKILFLTHAHDDHAGFLNEVLELTGARVILHPKAIEGLKRGQNSFEGGCSSRLAYFFCLVLAMFGKGAHRYSPLREEFLDRLIPIDSEAFRKMHVPFQVIETPGHTSDHISMLKDGIMFCGDAAMNNFPSIRRVIIWIENLPQFRRSWETVLKISPTMLYPAHGKPFPTADLKKFLPSLDRIRLYPLKHER
ncbi:MAG: MBL fold metallo-hydrolase [Parasporobacterium sp.]|nr:MBL fold metallo-hydrolase [Parasporobacterium sp.]